MGESAKKLVSMTSAEMASWAFRQASDQPSTIAQLGALIIAMRQATEARCWATDELERKLAVSVELDCHREIMAIGRRAA